MISRLSALAAAFAIVGTTALGVAASARQPLAVTPSKVIRSVRLDTVVVTAKRLPTATP